MTSETKREELLDFNQLRPGMIVEYTRVRAYEHPFYVAVWYEAEIITIWKKQVILITGKGNLHLHPHGLNYYRLTTK